MPRASAQRVMVRPGGRTEETRQAVARAVLDMVAAGNLLFDLSDVADLSGVHRTTITRRWPDRDALLAEAMAEHTSRFSIDLRGDWKTVLRAIAFGVRDFMNDPVEDALNRIVAISASKEFTGLVARHWANIFADLAKPLLAAQEKGRIAKQADVPLTLTMVSYTILSFAVYARRPMDDVTVERLVRQTIRGMIP